MIATEMDFWARPDMKKFVPLPTEPEAERTFSTYCNYLLHMDRCLAGEYGVGESFIPSVISVLRGMPKVTKIGRRRPTDDDVKRVRNSWRLAWAKELQLRIPGMFDADVLPYFVQGSGIHVYYVVYHSARALFCAAGQPVSPQHSKTLSALSSWVKDRAVMPVPWSVASEGGPDRAAMKVFGKPPHASTSNGISSLSNPSSDTVWSSLDMFLCTTRERQIDNRKKQWREQNDRSRVPSTEATKLATRLPATTLFDGLFRLRKRSDYSDADAFLEGIPSGFAAEKYHSAISTFVPATQAVLESLAVAYVGPDLYKSAADRFLQQGAGLGSTRPPGRVRARALCPHLRSQRRSSHPSAAAVVPSQEQQRAGREPIDDLR
jgi:hypothetical protein